MRNHVALGLLSSESGKARSMRAILSGFVAAVMVAVIAGGGAWGAGGPSGRFYLHFSGNAQYVEIPAAEDLSVGPEGFTVSAWMKPDTLEFAKTEGSGYVYWMGKGAPNQQEWAMRMYSRTNREKPPRPNRISFYLFNLSGGLGEGSYFEEPVHPGEWILVTAVVAGDTVAMFRNGEYVRCDQLNGGAKPGCQAHDERIHPTVGTAPVRLGTRDFKSFFQGGLRRCASGAGRCSRTKSRGFTGATRCPGVDWWPRSCWMRARATPRTTACAGTRAGSSAPRG